MRTARQPVLPLEIEDPALLAPAAVGERPARDVECAQILRPANPGDGGTLRSTPAQFSYPVPPGVQALSYQEPDVRILQAEARLDIGWSDTVSVSDAVYWLALGGGDNDIVATSDLYIEVDLP